MMAGDIFIQHDPGLLLCKSICSRKGLEGQIHGKTLDWKKPKDLKKDLAPTPQTFIYSLHTRQPFLNQKESPEGMLQSQTMQQFLYHQISVSTIKKKSSAPVQCLQHKCNYSERDPGGWWCERPSLLRLCATGPASLWLVVKITKLLERMNQISLDRTE